MGNTTSSTEQTETPLVETPPLARIHASFSDIATPPMPEITLPPHTPFIIDLVPTTTVSLDLTLVNAALEKYNPNIDIAPMRLDLSKLTQPLLFSDFSSPAPIFPSIPKDLLIQGFNPKFTQSIPIVKNPLEEENNADYLESPNAWTQQAQPVYPFTEENVLNAIKEQLSQFNCIRILLRRGRGYGHQGAAVRIMEELCRLGFTGRFSLVCIDEIFDENPKLHPLVKFNELIAGHEYLPKRIDYPTELDFVDLTINPGDDRLPLLRFATLFEDLFASHSNYYLTMNLANWSEVKNLHWLRILGGTHIRLSDNNDLPDHYQPMTPQFFDNTPYAALLAALASAHTQQNCLLQLMYGLYPEDMQNKEFVVNPQKILNLALNSLVNLQKKLKGKPIVVLFPSEEFTADALRDLLNTLALDNLLFTDNITELSQLLLQPPKNKIIFALTPRLPKRVFETILMEYSTLTPIVEGASATAQLQKHRDFLHGFSSKYSLELKELSEDTLLAFSANQNQQQLHLTSCHALENGDDSTANIAHLSEFLHKVYLGEFTHYFSARRTTALQKSYFLHEALFAIAQHPILNDPLSRAKLLVNECTLLMDALEKFALSAQTQSTFISIHILHATFFDSVIPALKSSISSLSTIDKLIIIEALRNLNERCKKIENTLPKNIDFSESFNVLLKELQPQAPSPKFDLTPHQALNF